MGEYPWPEDAAKCAANYTNQFEMPVLFYAVCAFALIVKGADTLIADATVPSIAARLPAWFREGVGAPSFLLLPLLLKGALEAEAKVGLKMNIAEKNPTPCENNCRSEASALSA